MSKISQNTGAFAVSAAPGGQMSDDAAANDVLFAALFGAEFNPEAETETDPSAIAGDMPLSAIQESSVIIAGGMQMMAQDGATAGGSENDGEGGSAEEQAHLAQLFTTQHRRGLIGQQAGRHPHSQGQADKTGNGNADSSETDGAPGTELDGLELKSRRAERMEARIGASVSGKSESQQPPASQITNQNTTRAKIAAPAEPAAMMKASELKSDRLGADAKPNSSELQAEIEGGDDAFMTGKQSGQNGSGQNQSGQNQSGHSQSGQNQSGHHASTQQTPAASLASAQPAPASDRLTPQQQLAETEQTAPTAEDWADMLDLMEDNWSEMLVRRIQNALGDKQGGIDFELNPRNLGKLRVTLNMAGDQTQVQMRTETQQAAQILTEAESRLAQMLEAQGMKLAQFGAQSGMGGNNQQMNNNSGQNSSGQDGNSVSSNTEETDENEMQSADAQPDDGRVNLQA